MSTLGTIKAAIDADIPVMIEGEPGTGKTKTVEALAREAGAHLETMIGSTMDPTDFGYLHPEGGAMRVLPPPKIRRIAEALARGQQAWLFLDEFSCMPPMMQAGTLRLVNEREVGDTDIRGCRMLAAQNAPEHAAGASDASAATSNRWLHIPWRVDPSAWIDGMLSGWKQAQDPTLAATRGIVASYIRKNPSALLDVPKEVAAQAHGWPSPRSWDHLARFLAVLGGTPTQAAQSEEGAQGADGLVGRHAGSEWLRWLSEVDLADPEEYLSGRVKLPSRGDRIAAALDSIVVAVLRDQPDRVARIKRGVELMASVRQDVGMLASVSLVKAMPQQLYKELPDAVIDMARKLQAVRA